MRTPQTDPWLIQYSGEHLLHELKMFRWLAGHINSQQDAYLHDAMVESFLLHLRNLIMFFCFLESDIDDVVAADFFDNRSKWTPTEPAALKDARERANKELTHLTSRRRNKGATDKDWDVAGLFNEIDLLAKKFASDASPNKVNPNVIELIMVPNNDVATVLGKHASMSNTTSSTLSYTSQSGSGPSKNNNP
jgi:hypothetical protein